MRRREFLCVVGCAVAAWPLAARAQGERMRQVGVLVNEPWPPLDALRQGLADLGYTDGKNIRMEYRFAQGRADQFPALAAELVALPVDVIVAWGTLATLAAKKATSTIPIIMSGGDPVGTGLVASLARPGGNVTGLSTQTAEGEGKRLELLKELIPNLSRVAVLSNPSNPYCVIAIEYARRAAAALRIELSVANAAAAADFDQTFLAIRAARPDAVLVLADPLLAGERARIAKFMLEARLPSIFTYHEHVVAGGLMAYATNYHDIFRREATYIDKIFRGAKPGDLPVEQPTKFELVINLKTAKALGVEVPWFMQQRANEVIE